MIICVASNFRFILSVQFISPFRMLAWFIVFRFAYSINAIAYHHNKLIKLHKSNVEVKRIAVGIYCQPPFEFRTRTLALFTKARMSSSNAYRSCSG